MRTLAILIKDLKFSYPGCEPVLGGVNMRIEDGTFALLVGNTGCGKSTLLKLMMPAVEPVGDKSGEIKIDGEIGWVSQSSESQLICDTVWHELAFPLENRGVSQAEMRRRVAEVAHYFGIGPWFGKKVDELSGGQKQLLNVAKTLATAPRVLLLDEPTAQLDPVAEKNLLHALFRINRELGITILVATHSPETIVDYATCAFAMTDGQVECTNLSNFKKFHFMPGIMRNDGPSTLRLRSGIESVTCSELVFDDVFFRYQKDEDWVLRGLDLEVFAGEIHALVGGNGCGKSTTLLVAAGINKIQRGKVTNSLKDSQALLSQNPKALFVRDSVFEELQEWQKTCDYTNDDIEAALEHIDLLGAKERHPFDLSGGEQQLLALTKLLLTKPKLLMLDEPTKGLDPQAELKVAHLLQEAAAAGTTILMATHDLSFAYCLADRITMLFDGQSTASETPQDFFNNNFFYRPTPNGFTEIFK